MKTGLPGLLALPFVFFSLSFTVSADDTAKVDYPEGYRDWTHVKSMIIHDNHPFADPFGGMHHVYANAAALKALKNRTAYPDGAMLVFDLFEVIRDVEGGTSSEGPRIRKDVMQKNSALWPDTSGWGYETFFGADNERIITDPIASCHNCHGSQIETDSVFSVWRD